MRRGPVAWIAAAAVVAVGGLGVVRAGADVTPDGSSLRVGYFQPGEQIALTNLTVADGTYRVRYGAEVQFFADRTDTVLACGLIDASGRIGYIDDTTFAVPGTGAWTRVGEDAAYDLPAVTLGIRCSPSAAGSFGVGYRDASLMATPAG
jgi:hypothetical protein